MSGAKRIQEVVEQALETGQLSEDEHEWILKEIHRDGEIDAQESALLSKLFRATQEGRLVVGSAANSTKRSHALEARKRDAIDRFTEREERRPLNGAAAAATAPEPLTADEKLDAVPDTSAETTNSHSSPSFEELFDTACQPRDQGPEFKLQNDRLLDVRLEGQVWMKTGSMVGYYGNITFTRERIGEHGISRMVKKALTGEGASLTKAIGSGNLYLADQGKKVSVIDLRGHSLTVNGHSILAFQERIDWNITFLKQLAAVISGGYFQVRLCGKGVVAITTRFDPIVLRVSPSHPVMTDYHATVAWSSSVTPSLRTDISMQTMIGRSSGETLQLAFHGDGFVVIQPFEERVPSQPS